MFKANSDGVSGRANEMIVDMSKSKKLKNTKSKIKIYIGDIRKLILLISDIRRAI